MVIYLPIIGAIALASGTVMERLDLNKRRVDVKLYQTASFLAIVLAMLPFLYFFWSVEPGAFSSKNIFIFTLVVFFSIIANLLVFYSLKGERIVKLEPARALEPLFTILLAVLFSIFFGEIYDGNTKIIVPAIVAGVALIFSHIQKHHLAFNKYFLAAVFGSFFFGLELVISRLILDFYSPLTFYFLRSSAIFLFSFLAFKPHFKKLDKKVRLEIFATGLIWLVYRLIVYYGYLSSGIVFTTLILMLAPIMLYLFAHFFLNERMSWKNFVAAIVIFASVVYATI